MAAETQLSQPEWTGGKSQKFTTNRRNIKPHQPDHNQPHPLFSSGQRKHYDQGHSKEFQFKPSVRYHPNKDLDRPEKASGVKYLSPEFGQNVKPRPERRHEDVGRQSTNTNEDMPVGKATFIMHNRKTQNEVGVTKSMGSKKRINTMFE